LIQNLSSHLNLTSLLDWKFWSLLIYIFRFAHATLRFLGSRGVGNLDWRMLFITIIASIILVLMITSTHKTTCTQFGNHWPQVGHLVHFTNDMQHNIGRINSFEMKFIKRLQLLKVDIPTISKVHGYKMWAINFQYN
jgi:hypothetical protein